MKRIILCAIFFQLAFSMSLFSQDFDLDGVPDVSDFDDDNDGICDVNELSASLANYVRDCNAPVSGTHAIGPVDFNFNNFAPNTPPDSNGNGSSTCPGGSGFRQWKCRTDLGGSIQSLASILPGADSVSYTTDFDGSMCDGFEYLIGDIDREDGLTFTAYSGGVAISADSVWHGPGIKDSLNFYWDTTASSGSLTDSVFQTRWYFNSGTCIDSVRVQFYTNKTTCQGGVNNLILLRSRVLDSDGDGLSDQYDIDADGDGCYDILEGLLDPNLDLDGDGIAGVGVATVDANGIPTIMTGACLPVLSLDYRDSNVISSACDTIIPGNENMNLNEDGSSSLNVLSNNTDINGDSMFVTVTTTTTANGGSASFNSLDSTILYTPLANFCGMDEVYYKVCDSTVPVLCIVDTIFVDVACVNDPPTNGNESRVTLEDFAIGNINLLNNNADPEADSLVLAIAPTSPGGGNITVTSAGVISYNPKSNYDGIDTIVYQVCDTVTPPLCVQDTLFMTVSPNNDVPQIVNDSFLINEDVILIFNPLVNDSDSNDVYGGLDSTSVDTAAGPPNGTVDINPITGEITYTPDLNFNGLDSFTIQVCDTGYPMPALCGASLVYIEVLAVPDPPMSAPEYVVIDEDSALTNFDVLSNNIDPENDSIIAGGYPGTSNQGHPVSQNADGTLDYFPPANWYGNDTIIINVCDTTGLCNTDTVFIVVTPVNDAPNINDDNVSLNEDTLITIDPLQNDDDFVDNGILDSTSVDTIAGPFNGTVTLITNIGTITYKPDTNFFGLDSFQIVVCDTGFPQPVLCDTSWVFIIVNPLDDPILNGNENWTINEDSVVQSFNLSANNSNVDLDTVIVNVPALSTQGGGIVQNSDGTIDYTPVLNFNGMDTILYTVCDTTNPIHCAMDTVFIMINSINDAPTIADSTYQVNVNDSLSACLNITDEDLPDDSLECTVLSGPSNGVWTDNPGNCFSYVPNTGWIGFDTIVKVVCDTAGLCDTATIIINTDQFTAAPVVTDDSLSMNEDDTLFYCFNVTDPNLPNDSVYTVIGSPSNGVVDSVNANCFNYIPTGNFNGLDTIIIIACDTGGLCDTGVIVINIINVSDVPTFGNETITINEDSTILSLDVLLNNTDPDGDSILVGNPVSTVGATITVNPDGTISYDPPANYHGVDTVLYNVCDTTTPQQCIQDTLFITLTPVNDMPIINDDTVNVDEDMVATFNPLNNDTDSNDVLGGINIASLETIPGTGPFNGTLVIDTATGNMIYTPDPNFNGNDSFQILVCDTGYPLPPLCDSSWVFIEVNSINDAPTAIDDTTSTDRNAAITIDVLTNDSDPENDPLSLLIFGNPIHGTAVVTNGQILYTPNTDFCGWDVFLYLACDGNVCDTALVLIEVIPADSDGDGIADFIEGTSDFDGDGLTNNLDLDSDNDGISDSIEASGDLSDPCNPIIADSDGDLSPDYLDLDSDGDGLSDNLEVTGAVLDTDGDLLFDFRDPDSDNDGIGDFEEYDADANGVVDDCDQDDIPDWLDPDVCLAEDLVIPQAFSPDGDGKNDLLEFPGITNFESNSLLIFNRWGNKVFEAAPYNNDWDAISSGSLNTGSGKVPAGTYYYVLDLGDGSEPLSGYIYISY
jgi:gliding motility-associated-like protein